MVCSSSVVLGGMSRSVGTCEHLLVLYIGLFLSFQFCLLLQAHLGSSRVSGCSLR